MMATIKTATSNAINMALIFKGSIIFISGVLRLKRQAAKLVPFLYLFNDQPVKFNKA